MTDPSTPLGSAMSAVIEPSTQPLGESDFLSATLAKLSATPEPVKEPEPEPAKEPAAAEPVAETDPLEEVDKRFPDLDQEETPAARAKWGELKTELKQERKQLREMRSRLEDLEKRASSDPEEVSTLRKQIEERDRELAVHRIEATKDYQDTITTPLQTIGEAAASVARRYELDQSLLFDALAERDEAKQQKLLQEMVDGMSDRDRLKVYQMADDTLLLLRKADDMRSRSHEALQELELRQKEAAERQAAESRRTFTSAVDKVFDALEDAIPFHPLEKGEVKTLVFDKLKSDVLASDFDNIGTDVKAYASAAGALLPRMVQQLRAIQAENQALKERLNGMSTAAPTRTPGAVTPEGRQTAGGSFLDSVFAGLGA